MVKILLAAGHMTFLIRPADLAGKACHLATVYSTVYKTHNALQSWTEGKCGAPFFPPKTLGGCERGSGGPPSPGGRGVRGWTMTFEPFSTVQYPQYFVQLEKEKCGGSELRTRFSRQRHSEAVKASLGRGRR